MTRRQQAGPLSAEEFETVQTSRPDRIRNISVIAHVDHGKSSLTDSLASCGGLIRREAAGDALFSETREDERQRGITIKSTGISLGCVVPSTGDPLLINLIDSPGHVDFSSEVTAALRITDGALVVVDCIEGVRVQTVTVLRQALAERVRPILVLNKFDRPFLERHDPEEIYLSLCRTIESVNVLISTNQPEDVDWTVSIANGSVVFSSAVQGWGFSVHSMAAKYQGKTKNLDRLAEKLWGDNFYDEATGVWYTSSVSPSGKALERGFCKFIAKPLASALDKARNCDPSALVDFAENKLKVRLSSEETSQIATCDQKHRAKMILQKWLPLDAALLEAISIHLPSPLVSQRYRTELLYTGPHDDETAKSMKECNPQGPLVVFISKMVPDDGSNRFLAFGRVFSGSVSTSTRVTIIDGKTGDRAENKSIQRVLTAMGKSFQQSSFVPAGNTVVLVGVDSYLSKSGTVISAGSKSFPLRQMTFSVSAVVRAAVRTTVPADLPKMLEALRKLSKSDQLVQVIHSPAGEHIVAAAGELHLEIALHDLREFMAASGASPEALKTSDPVVPFLESVVNPHSLDSILAKSANKLNRIFIKAESMSPDFVCSLEEHANSSATQSDSTPQQMVADHYHWTTSESRKLWSIGPEFAASESSASPTCIIVDSTTGVQYLTEVKDSVCAGFAMATREGPLCGEPLRGVRFDLTDALVHADSRHRGVNQIGQAARRAALAACLAAGPRLVEPIYLLEVSCQRPNVGQVYSLLGRRRAVVREEVDSGSGVVVRAYLPVVESFGFNAELRAATAGQAFPQLTFDHWQIIPDDPLQPGTAANKLVKQIRKAKGLSEQIPQISDFADKL